MAYATVSEVEAGFRPLDTDEQALCSQLLDEAAIIIDAYNADADVAIKELVSCRMVRRAIGDGMQTLPLGSTQGSIAAGGYSQSWTVGGGTSGELYISRSERRMLGVGNKIGSKSPTEDLTYDPWH